MNRLLNKLWIGLLLLLPWQKGIAGFPEKPLTFIVHSKPGSAIDITTRQLTRIAAKYTDATFLVENKTGGSGVVAMRYVLDHPADGYMVQAVTKSFISTVLISNSGIRMNDFDFLACLVVDPEVLITNRHSSVRTLEDIINDARQKKGRQKWLGPLVGGVDHLMAVKTWEKLGISGEWIPFEGGSDALAALMGHHGVVYVGNPVDVIGRPDLMIAVVAAPQRLPDYPDVPTFVEKGFDLPNEVLWRGYAVKKGIPAQAERFWLDLFHKVSQDSEWISYIRNTGAQPVYIAGDEFTAMVERDQQEAIKYLRMAGILADQTASPATYGKRAMVYALALLIVLMLLYGFKRAWLRGEIVISLILIALAVFLYQITLDFPRGKLGNTAGPAAMPRLWIYGLIFFNLWLIAKIIWQKPDKVPFNGQRFLKSGGLVLAMAGYLVLMPYAGYYLSTLLFLVVGMYWMGYRKHLWIWLISAGFVLFSYYVFWKVLQVPLPKGILLG